MRWTAFFFLFATLAGCTSQTSGQRCQQNSDCNTDTDTCRIEINPERDCPGNGACICCPTNPAAASAITACLPRVGRTDSGVTDTGPEAGTITDTGPEAGAVTDTGPEAGTVTDTGPEAGTVADAGPSCASNSDCGAGFFCNGASCGGAGNCVTRPVASTCAPVLNTVCGCDLRTYSNACEAAAAGVRSTAGVCPVVDAGAVTDVVATD